MFNLHKTFNRNMELWEKLSAELDAFHERMERYESLPEEERIEKYRKEHILSHKRTIIPIISPQILQMKYHKYSQLTLYSIKY